MRAALLGVVAGAVMYAPLACAQDLEPRAYSSSPVGANFLVASYSGSFGDVIFDPTLPITDVHATVQGLALGVGHSFNLFGRLGLVTAGMPYALAHVTGKVFEEHAETDRSGLADARFRLSVNLRGNPAMSPREFVRAPRRVVVGASLTVAAPAGQYYDTKLINLGSNRWAFKPEVGVSFPKGKWDLDAYVGAWIFTENDDFYPGGAARTQDPMVGIQGHAAYTFKPRLWVAADGTWYRGGSARVNAGNPSSVLNGSRVGLTASMPLGKRYSVKVAYTSGLWALAGANFRTVSVGWQALWLSRRWAGR